MGCSAEVVGLSTQDPHTDRESTKAPFDAPVVSIAFPTAFSLTDATSLTIRGHVSDAHGVRSVRINGVTADTDDDFASWELIVSLSSGENVLVVESEDRAGTVARAARVVVRSEPLLFMSPDAVVVEEAARRALVVDRARQQLAAIDLDTGRRALISGESRGRGPTWSFLTQIALDTVNRRAILVDSPAPFRPTDGAVVAIDLDSGDRTLISDTTTGTGPLFSSAVGVAVDSANRRALVFALRGAATGEPWALLAIDLETGNRRIVSSPTTGSGRSLLGGRGMTLDVSRHRALVVVTSNGYTGLVAVDLQSGDRTSITDPTTEFGVGYGPSGAVLDAANDRVLTVASSGVTQESELIAIDSSTGDRVVHAPSSKYGYSAIAFDGVTGRPIVVAAQKVTDDLRIGQLLTVDLDSGASVPVSPIGIGAGPAIAAPSDVGFDSIRGRALVVDRENGLVAVDLGTADRTIFSDLPGDAALVPTHLALDEANHRAFIAANAGSATQDRIVSVDLGSGDLMAIDGVGVELAGTTGIALDSARNRALVTAFRGPPPIIAMAAVDLVTGTRTALITTEPGQGPRFIFDALTVDAANTRALVVDSMTNSVVAVDLVTSARTTISEDVAGAGPSLGRAIVLDEAGQRALVIGNRLISVSLATGQRRFLSNEEDAPTLPTGLARYSSPCCALIVDDGLDAVVLVDLVTGERVIVSGHTAD